MEGLLDFFRNLFDAETFQPRHTCMGWWDELRYLHMTSDFLIFAAYVAIPCILLYFIRKRKDLPFQHIFWLFGAFILLCGATHFMGLLSFIRPMYRFDGMLKLLTALVSCATAVALIPVVPRFLALRSPEELEKEIVERKNVEEQLRTLNQTLEQRVAERTAELESRAGELATANACLEAAAAELRRSASRQARLVAIIEATPDLVGIAEGNLHNAYINRAGRSLLGLSPSEDVTQTTVREFHAAADWERMEQEVLPLVHQFGIWSGENRIRRRDGSLFPVSQVILAHRDATGSIEFISTVARDLTEAKRTEDERRSMESQMQHVQRLESLGVLAGGIAHDFNNLLMAILGNTDLALHELPPASPVRRRIEQVQTTAQRAADLTQQMLAYSGKGRFVIEPADLNALVEEMVDLLKVSIGKRAELRLELTRPLPAVDADVAQLRQVLMNLLTNAADAIGSADGTITLRTGALHASRELLAATVSSGELAPGEYVFLEVCDTGCGMDAATQARIFDPFFTTKFTGRGLGLAAVLGIVRGHKGAIRVESAPGQGTTFRILLPAAVRQHSRVLAAVTAPRAWTGTGTVLVVDDEEHVRELLKDMLESLGFSVVTAADGTAGLQLFSASPYRFTCVFLDLTMPHMGGEEAFQRIRALRGDQRVILTSGYSDTEVQTRFAGKGLSGFLQKPFLRSQLVELLKHLHIGSGLHRALTPPTAPPASLAGSEKGGPEGLGTGI